MIVRTVAEAAEMGARVETETWTSTRLLLRSDGMGLTLTESVLEPGMDETLWYKHHLEACFCVEGDAVLEDLETGKTFGIRPGTMYALDAHDRHRIRARSRTRLICVFTPALTGREVHDPEGSYSLPDDAR